MSDESTSPTTAGERKASAREINDTIRFTMWSVFAVRGHLGEGHMAQARQVDDLLEELGEKGLTVRGWYDVGGLRADADVMVWWHAPEIETLQRAYHSLRKTTFGRALEPVWSVAAVHRPAEFNKGHVPAFMAGEEPRDYLCVYPFVRSYEWYLLPDEDRRRMLADHGMKARAYGDVRANTVSSFALGDYEWILAFEADELHRIVDLMRDLRATDARLHVREELPFYTGRRLPLSELIHELP